PFAEPPNGGKQPKVGKTARTAFVATLVVLGVLVLALALWKLKVVIALVFFGLIIAAAMRPGVDRLAEWRIPRPAGVLLHYLAIGLKAFAGLVGILFVFAVAAYWIFERDRTIRLVLSLAPSRHRQVIRDTWELIDLKLGAFVRGQLLLITLVSTTLSLGFWAVGLPFWLLVGVVAGIFELVPVIGPIAAGALAVGVGLTQSWHVALAAGIVVLVVRLLEDYVVIPRVMGHVTGLSPLLVLVGV